MWSTGLIGIVANVFKNNVDKNRIQTNGVFDSDYEFVYIVIFRVSGRRHFTADDMDEGRALRR